MALEQAKQDLKFERKNMRRACLTIAQQATALQAIADEAVKHHEHNLESGKDRLPAGYGKILDIAIVAQRVQEIQPTKARSALNEKSL